MPMVRCSDVNRIYTLVRQQISEIRVAHTTLGAVGFINSRNGSFDVPFGRIAHRDDLGFGTGKETFPDHMHPPRTRPDQADGDPVAGSDRAIQAQRGRRDKIGKSNCTAGNRPSLC